MLVIHAWWGLNDFCKGVCDRLAGAGFVAAAPDLFEGQVATTIADARRLRARRKREPTYRTLLRAIEQLQSHPAVQGAAIGVLGLSMGGHWALWLAQRRELPIAAVVTYYGARAGDYTGSRAAFLGHFAQTDEWVSDAARARLAKTLATAGREAAFFVYPGTGHWFAESDRADAFDPQAAALAWKRTIRFLRRSVRAKG